MFSTVNYTSTKKLVYTKNLIGLAYATDDNMSALEQALEDLSNGRPVFVYDADGREEETDIVFYSGLVGPEDVRLMRKEGGGLICTTIIDRLAEDMGIPFLVDVFHAAEADFPVLKDSLPSKLPYDTKSAFSLTFNHRKCYTGITDKDRSMTISEFGRLVEQVDDSQEDDPGEAFASSFRVPGHVFLLRTSKHILKDRFGHTELSTALCIMAGLPPTATICEMMGDDGNALSKERARHFAEENGFQFLEGKDIVEVWKKWSE